MPRSFRSKHRPLALALAAAACLIAGGCNSTSANLTLRSTANPVELAPVFSTGVYYSADQHSADIYLSDLPLETISARNFDPATVTGSIVHINLFVLPKAGSTPIDPTACSASFRQAVMAGGQTGLYGGGGFVLPSSSPGDSSMRGSVLEITARLLRSTEAFDDRIGPSTMTGKFSAPKNESAARAVAQNFQRLVASLPTVPSEAQAPAEAD